MHGSIWGRIISTAKHLLIITKKIVYRGRGSKKQEIHSPITCIKEYIDNIGSVCQSLVNINNKFEGHRTRCPWVTLYLGIVLDLHDL